MNVNVFVSAIKVYLFSGKMQPKKRGKIILKRLNMNKFIFSQQNNENVYEKWLTKRLLKIRISAKSITKAISGEDVARALAKIKFVVGG